MQIDCAMFVEPSTTEEAVFRVVAAYEPKRLPFDAPNLSLLVRIVFTPDECDSVWTMAVRLRDPDGNLVVVAPEMEYSVHRHPFDAHGYVNTFLPLTGITFESQGIYIGELKIYADAREDSRIAHETRLPVRLKEQKRTTSH